MRENILVSRRVRIEVMRGGAHPCDVGRAMRTEQRLIGSFVRQTPFPFRVLLSKIRRALRDSGRPFGMTRSGIFRASRIVENNHALCRTRPAKFAQ